MIAAQRIAPQKEACHRKRHASECKQYRTPRAVRQAKLGQYDNPHAEHNNEQIMVTNDPVLVAGITETFDGLDADTQRSISEEVERRNKSGDVANDEVDAQSRHDDTQASGR